jgi:hypothetical protein
MVCTHLTQPSPGKKALPTYISILIKKANAHKQTQANFPNLRRLFIEARSEDEEREVSRKAVSLSAHAPRLGRKHTPTHPQPCLLIISLGPIHHLSSGYNPLYFVLATQENNNADSCVPQPSSVLQCRAIHGLSSCLQPDSAADERRQVRWGGVSTAKSRQHRIVSEGCISSLWNGMQWGFSFLLKGLAKGGRQPCCFCLAQSI